jgi:hypothetical protein
MLPNPPVNMVLEMKNSPALLLLLMLWRRRRRLGFGERPWPHSAPEMEAEAFRGAEAAATRRLSGVAGMWTV